MKYVMSDIHGCYDKFIAMLNKIDFKESDTLYILGDVIDRGEKSLEILNYIKSKQNIILTMGNHEQLFLKSIEDKTNTPLWLYNGGYSTLVQMESLNKEDFHELYQYIKNLPLIIKEGKYILCHAGLLLPENYKELSVDDIIEQQVDEYLLWDREFFKSDAYIDGYTVIVGHTPTISVSQSNEIIKKKGKILIDCGAVFDQKNGVLACLRLDDLKEFYI